MHIDANWAKCLEFTQCRAQKKAPIEEVGTPVENGNSSSLKCLGRRLYFLKRVYTWVFKNGKMKIFHTCPKE